MGDGAAAVAAVRAGSTKGWTAAVTAVRAGGKKVRANEIETTADSSVPRHKHSTKVSTSSTLISSVKGVSRGPYVVDCEIVSLETVDSTTPRTCLGTGKSCLLCMCLSSRPRLDAPHEKEQKSHISFLTCLSMIWRFRLLSFPNCLWHC